MKQYLNDYYYELNKLDALVEEENSYTNKINSYSFIGFIFDQALKSATLIGHISPPMLTNNISSNPHKSLLSIRRDELREEIRNLEKSKKLILLTELSYAVVKKDENQVAILSNSYNINLKDDLGNTALHYAAKYGHFTIMITLIHKGGNLSIENDNHQKPLALIPSQYQEEAGVFIKGRSEILYKMINLPYELCLKIVEYEYGVKMMQSVYLDQEILLLGENITNLYE